MGAVLLPHLAPSFLLSGVVLATLTACPEREPQADNEPHRERALQRHLPPDQDHEGIQAPDESESAADEPADGSSARLKIFPLTDPEHGPFRVGPGIKPPQLRREERNSLEDLNQILASGEYTLGVCIFRLTISAEGGVEAVTFLRPESGASEVRAIILEGAKQWRFRPATKDGQPVPVYHHIHILHCPLYRAADEQG